MFVNKLIEDMYQKNIFHLKHVYQYILLIK